MEDTAPKNLFQAEQTT